MIIDTHCHLDKDDYLDIEKVISNMNNNVMIASGCNIETSKNVLELVNKYNNIFGTVGIHPNEVDDMTDENLKIIEEMLKNPKIVGIGEIGLDYHYGMDNKNLQIEYFIKQINLAKKYNKTIVIHSRDAALDTYNILSEHLGNLKAVMHCYSYSYEMAIKYKSLGVLFGIGGVLTFKNSEKLKKIVNEFPLSNLVVETDSPYLTPEPFRGQKNEPKNVKLVIKEISKLKGITEEEVANITTKNAISLFDLQI